MMHPIINAPQVNILALFVLFPFAVAYVTYRTSASLVTYRNVRTSVYHIALHIHNQQQGIVHHPYRPTQHIF